MLRIDGHRVNKVKWLGEFSLTFLSHVDYFPTARNGPSLIKAIDTMIEPRQCGTSFIRTHRMLIAGHILHCGTLESLDATVVQIPPRDAGLRTWSCAADTSTSTQDF